MMVDDEYRGPWNECTRTSCMRDETSGAMTCVAEVKPSENNNDDAVMRWPIRDTELPTANTRNRPCIRLTCMRACAERSLCRADTRSSYVYCTGCMYIHIHAELSHLPSIF